MTTVIAIMKLKPAMVWALSLLGLTGLFFLLTFPYDQLQGRVLAELSQRSGLRLHADSWSFAGPVGIEWSSVDVQGKDVPRVLLDRLQVSLRLGDLLQGRSVIDGMATVAGTGDAKDGRLTARLQFLGWPFSGPADLKGRVDLRNLAVFGVPRIGQGRLEGDFHHQWAKFERLTLEKGLLEGQAEWTLKGSDLVLDPIQFGAFTVPRIRLAEVSGQVKCEDARCRVPMLEGEGPDGRLTGNGSVTLHTPLRESQLTLSVAVTPSAGLLQKTSAQGLTPALGGRTVTFNLNGPIARPQVTL